MAIRFPTCSSGSGDGSGYDGHQRPTKYFSESQIGKKIKTPSLSHIFSSDGDNNMDARGYSDEDDRQHSKKVLSASWKGKQIDKQSRSENFSSDDDDDIMDSRDYSSEDGYLVNMEELSVRLKGIIIDQGSDIISSAAAVNNKLAVDVEFNRLYQGYLLNFPQPSPQPPWFPLIAPEDQSWNIKEGRRRAFKDFKYGTVGSFEDALLCFGNGVLYDHLMVRNCNASVVESIRKLFSGVGTSVSPTTYATKLITKRGFQIIENMSLGLQVHYLVGPFLREDLRVHMIRELRSANAKFIIGTWAFKRFCL